MDSNGDPGRQNHAPRIAYIQRLAVDNAVTVVINIIPSPAAFRVVVSGINLVIVVVTVVYLGTEAIGIVIRTGLN